MRLSETQKLTHIFHGFKFGRNKIRAKCLILHFTNQHELRRRCAVVPRCQRKNVEIPEHEILTHFYAFYLKCVLVCNEELDIKTECDCLKRCIIHSHMQFSFRESEF